MASNWRLVVNGTSVDPETNYGFVITQWAGAGMPPIDNVSTDFGLLDGGIFQRQRAGVRSFSIQGVVNGSSVTDLHTKRQLLINAVKPDRSASQQPVVIQYTGGASTVQASAYYDEGLSLGEVDVYRENIGLRFLMFDPYWEKTTSSSATLTTQASFSNANYIVQRSASGVWGSLSTGVSLTTGGNGAVTALLTASGGNLFIGGAFNSAGTAACCVVKWNGSSFASLNASTNGQVMSFAIDSLDTTLYAGGLWNTWNASTQIGIVKLTGTTWGRVGAGSGTNVADVRSVDVAYDGSLYIGGNFSSIDGVSACRVAKFSNSTWSALDGGLGYTGVGTGRVYSIAQGVDTAIYAGGNFNQASSALTTACGLVRWNGANWSTVASGANLIYSMAVGADGTIYAGTGLNTALGAAACRIAKTNNLKWEAMGAGVNNTVDVVYYAASINTLFAGGNFTTAGSIPTSNGAAFWNGSVWFPLDITLPSSASVYAFDYSSGKLTLGFSASGNASAAGVTTITTTGTAVTYPIMSASAPTSSSARLYQMINYTTGEAIYFNLTLQPGEIVTLDLTPGKKSFTSTFRGNIINTILPGSNVTTWRLLSGSNAVSFWMSGGSGAAKLTWYDRYWSIDV